MLFVSTSGLFPLWLVKLGILDCHFVSLVAICPINSGESLVFVPLKGDLIEPSLVENKSISS